MRLQLALLFAFIVCSQALTVNEAAGGFYTINARRYQDLIVRMKDAMGSDTKNAFLKYYRTTFAFSCSQVSEILKTYSFDSDRINGLALLKNNIIDVQNKASIISVFDFSDGRNQATNYLATAVSCNTDGVAPEKFPILSLPFRDQWERADVEALVRAINKASFSDRKLQIAEDALTSTSKILTSDQAALLYESFSFSSDMLALTEFVKDRIVGLTCEQVRAILSRFSFSSDQLNALAAFKHNIIDPENQLILVDSFSLSSYKEKALKILDGLKPKSSLFGIPEGKVVFLLDVSASMSTSFSLNIGGMSNRLDFVKKEFIKTIRNFDSSTQFTVFSYSSNVTAWNTTLQKATQANILDAILFTQKLTPNGGTNIYGALQAAWAVPGVDTIYLLTDGTPSAGMAGADTILSEVRAWTSNRTIKVNTIAFLMGNEGYDDKPNSRKLMSALAEATNGIYRAMESDY